MGPFEVIKGAEQIVLPGSKRCFLLFHGFTGYPGEMRYLARGVNEKLGMSVFVPRLPGHGTGKDDFYRSGMRDWLRKALDSYVDMKASCDEVVVGGLSMGGILATIVSAVFGVSKTLLYAPAHTTTHQKYKPLAYLLSLFVKRKLKKTSVSKEDFEDETRKRIWEEYWRYDHFKQAREFFRLQSLGRKLLPKLGGSVLIVVSKADKTVPWTVADYIEAKSSAKVDKVILERSSHVVVNGEEKDKVLEVTVEWLQSFRSF